MAFLIDDILLSPISLVAWAAGKLKEAAETERTDDSAVRGELLDLQIRLELGEISEEDFLREEGRLLERLEEIQGCKEGDDDGDAGRAGGSD